jgi:alanine racemase
VDNHGTVTVNLDIVRRNAERIARTVGVPVIAVVKADAYGLGAARVAGAIGDLVQGFCVLHLREAIDANLWGVARKAILCLAPLDGEQASDFVAAHVYPAVWNIERAKQLKSALPALAVDTGMQRFAASVRNIESILAAGDCREAFTHAMRLEQVELLQSVTGKHGLRLHAAGSSLLHEPRAWLDAVRPGIALYRGAARVSARLVEVRDSNRPAGYSGFVVPRFGVILRGYRHGLRIGPCVINGQRRRILEVGMQSAFVEIGSSDGVGDEVVLLGDGLSEAEIAKGWKTSEHEALVNLLRQA